MNRIISEELYKFLDGESELDGLSFGDVEAGRPKYWWRKYLTNAPLATALDLSGVRTRNFWIEDDDYAKPHTFVEVSDLATLQPLSGQVGEALEAGIVIAKAYREVAEHFNHPVAKETQNGIDDMEKALQALRQPVETVGEVVPKEDILSVIREWKTGWTNLPYIITGEQENQLADDLMEYLSRALRTQPQAWEATPIGWGWKNEMGITEVRTDRMSKEMIAKLNAFPVYTQPQAPVYPKLSFHEWMQLPDIRGASKEYYEGAEHAWEFLTGEDLDFEDTQPQAPESETFDMVESATNELLKLGIQSLGESQAPVCTRCKDPIKVGVCENCAPEIEPQAPVVDIFEELARYKEKAEHLGEALADEIADNNQLRSDIALLQSRKEPVVEVPNISEAVEEINEARMTVLDSMEKQSTVKVIVQYLDNAVALLQSKGGR